MFKVGDRIIRKDGKSFKNYKSDYIYTVSVIGNLGSSQTIGVDKDTQVNYYSAGFIKALEQRKVKIGELC